MLLECRIPISPRPAWLRRVQLIRDSLREWYPDTLVTICCYPKPTQAELEAGGMDLTDHLYNWRYPKAADFDRWAGTRAEYLETMMSRYRAPFHGDYVLMLDADVIPIRPFNEWFQKQHLCGVQAHIPPISTQDWCALFTSFGLPQPDMRHQYSGVGVMCQPQLGPFYPNSGAILGRRELFERLEGPYFEAIEHLRAHVADAYWFDQLGLALGIAAADIRGRSYGLRYNFPNRPAFDRAFADELADVRFLHAMQCDVVDRDRDFASEEAIAALCARADLDGSNEALRRRITALRCERNFFSEGN